MGLVLCIEIKILEGIYIKLKSVKSGGSLRIVDSQVEESDTTIEPGKCKNNGKNGLGLKQADRHNGRAISKDSPAQVGCRRWVTEMAKVQNFRCRGGKYLPL